MRTLFAFVFASWLAAASLAAAPTIVVDAGHGGIDRGGMPGQKVPEKGYTLAVARRLAAKLRGAGFRVVMTRDSDVFIGLRERCATANRLGNAVFVSIHFNGAPRTTASGVETYYFNRRSASLAAAAHRQVVRALGTPDRGVRQRGFYVIRHTDCPSILIEGGFLTNPEEARRLASPGVQDRLAGAVARAVTAQYR